MPENRKIREIRRKLPVVLSLSPAAFAQERRCKSLFAWVAELEDRLKNARNVAPLTATRYVE